MKFIVAIEKTVRSVGSIEVDAENSEEARKKAYIFRKYLDYSDRQEIYYKVLSATSKKALEQYD